MCEWSNPWHMLIVFARHALFLIHVAYCILFITLWQPCDMAENQIKFAPQPFKRVHPHITIPHCEPTSSLMSSRAQSALAGLNGSDVKDSPNNLISASSRTTGHAVDIGCLCTSYCLMWRIFSDYFSCFLSRLIRWFVAFVLHCFSLFALFVVLKFSSPVSLLFSLWHWAQESSFVDYLNTCHQQFCRCLFLDWQISSGPQNSTASTWCRENMQLWVGGEKCCFRGEQAKKVEEEEYSRRVISIWSWDQDACKEIQCDGWNVFLNY